MLIPSWKGSVLGQGRVLLVRTAPSMGERGGLNGLGICGSSPA